MTTRLLCIHGADSTDTLAVYQGDDLGITLALALLAQFPERRDRLVNLDTAVRGPVTLHPAEPDVV